MNSTVKHLVKFICMCCCAMVITSCHKNVVVGMGYGGKHVPLVAELAQQASLDQKFHDELVEALVKRPADNYWQGKNLEDLYTFFDSWAVALPPSDPSKARFYDDTFGSFYSQDKKAIEPAKSLTRRKPLLDWLDKFVMERGHYMDSPESAQVVMEWMQNPAINMDDYIVPQGGFTSFNQFFTRNIKPGVRPIASPKDDAIVISPADSSISQQTIPLGENVKLEVKGMQLGVDKLLADDPIAKDFYGGVAAVFSLGVTDYHHFHAPVSGKILKTNLIGGLRFGVTTFDEFFTENQRGYCIIETDKYGKVAIIPIGITTIGSVVLSRKSGESVIKGDEIGNFAYGGSAILVLFQRDRFRLAPFASKEHVLMGRAVGTLI